MGNVGRAVDSTAPLSHQPHCGRAMPRWSVVAEHNATGIRPTAGPDGTRLCVFVGPPLSARVVLRTAVMFRPRAGRFRSPPATLFGQSAWLPQRLCPWEVICPWVLSQSAPARPSVRFPAMMLFLTVSTPTEEFILRPPPTACMVLEATFPVTVTKSRVAVPKSLT